MSSSAPQDVPQKEAPPGTDTPETAQTFWMDQQGNVYYATGFPGGSPQGQQGQTSPMSIPNHSAGYAPSFQPGGTAYPQQGWQQQGMQNIYNEGYYYPSGYEQQQYGYQQQPYHNYGPPDLNLPHGGAARGTPAHSPNGSPVQSPVNSPGRYGEMHMVRALQQHDPSWPSEMSMAPMGVMQPIEWEDMKGRVVALCKTRTGSVAIQSQLEECSPEVLDEILSEMIGSLAGLISGKLPPPPRKRPGFTYPSAFGPDRWRFRTLSDPHAGPFCYQIVTGATLRGSWSIAATPPSVCGSGTTSRTASSRLRAHVTAPGLCRLCWTPSRTLISSQRSRKRCPRRTSSSS